MSSVDDDETERGEGPGLVLEGGHRGIRGGELFCSTRAGARGGLHAAETDC